MRVLVVDDDARMAGAIRRGLQYEGLVVDVAAGGEEALRVARATEYDVVVLDVLMPGLDGFETCRRLKADPASAHIPVVFMTPIRRGSPSALSIVAIWPTTSKHSTASSVGRSAAPGRHRDRGCSR